MRFLKILIMALLFEEYQCKREFRAINATHCEYKDKRAVSGKNEAKNVTKVTTFIQTNKDNRTSLATRLEVVTLLKPVYEIVKKVQCCKDYKPGPKKTCIPKCLENCENGKCTAPNKCTCNEGYKELSSYRCIPHCESCDKGLCIGPNICECYRDHHKNETGQCVPTCNEPCVNGFCSKPDECTCPPGYELDKANKYKCLPICTKPCIQGACIAPDVCDCHPGYEFKNGSQNECLPICDFCESGNCTGPSRCTCWDNYEEQEIVQGKNVVKICQPKCMDECINGYCIEVDTCSCKAGYEFIKDSFNECEPICDPPCQNGDCVEPNTCSCDPGYDIIDGQCQAQCDNECINGFCLYPNQCKCSDGYSFSLNSTNVCEAFCETCPNGFCVEPDVCQCSEGFKMSETKVCEKQCEPECINGACVNGTCNCNDGFELQNGICMENVTPECKDDYTTTTEQSELVDDVPISTENEECNDENNCVPVCGINEEGCINGTCIATGVCECFDGFELYPSDPYVCVLEKITAIESAPVKAYITSYVSIILCLLIICLTGITLIFVLNRRNRKVNYNVDEKERKVGVNDEDYVHYITDKDDTAFA